LKLYLYLYLKKMPLHLRKDIFVECY